MFCSSFIQRQMFDYKLEQERKEGKEGKNGIRTTVDKFREKNVNV